MSGNWLASYNTSNSFIRTYVQGFVDISGGNVLLRNNNLLLAGGDASLNGRLFVTLDTSSNGRLFTGGDVSLNGRLYAGSDVSLSGRLFANSIQVGGTTITNTGAALTSTNIVSDATNSSMFGLNTLQNNTGTNNTGIGYNAGTTNITGSNNTFLGANTNTTGTAFNQSTALGYGAQITGNNQIIFGTSTEKTVFAGDVSLNGRLFVGLDTTIGGNSTINGNLTVGSLNVTGATVTGITGSGGSFISSTTSNMISTNTATYGQTWSVIPGTATSAAYQSVSISSTGQYMLCASGNSLFVSNNYGTNFITPFSSPVTISQIPSSTSVLYGSTMTANYLYLLVGNGTAGVGTMGTLASGQADLSTPAFLSVDSTGIYVAENGNNRVSFISKTNQYVYGSTMSANYIYLLAGTSSNTTGVGTMGSLAYGQANMNGANGAAVDSYGVYITEYANNRVSFISKTNQYIYGSTMSANYIYVVAGPIGGSTAGTGTMGVLAYGQSVTSGPSHSYSDSNGIYIADFANNRVTFVSRTNQYFMGSSMSANYIYLIAGTISNTSGTGTMGIAASGQAVLNHPQTVCTDTYGIYISETANNRVTFVSKLNQYIYGSTMSANYIYLIAGTSSNTSGLGTMGAVAAGQAVLNNPMGVHVDSLGIYIATYFNPRVLFIPKSNQYFMGSSMSANYIYLIAGTATGSSGTGSLGTIASGQACLGAGLGVYTDNIGIYMSDMVNNKIFFIPFTTTTTTTTTAGTVPQISTTSISSTGQYQLLGSNGNTAYLSTNYGTSYNAISIAGITSAAFSAVAISSTGQYQIAAINPGSIYISNNYGTTFSQNTRGLSTTGAYSGVSISSTGQYQLASINGGSVYLSSNYGNSFFTVPSLSTGTYKSVSMSSTGQYMLTCSAQSTGTTTTPPPTIVSGTSPTSTTYGSYTVLTFTTATTTTLTFPANTTIGYVVVGGGSGYGTQVYNGGAGGGTSWGTIASGMVLPSQTTITVTVANSTTSTSGNTSSISGGSVYIVAYGGYIQTGGGAGGGANNGSGGAGGPYGGWSGSNGTLVNIPDIGISSYYGGGGGGGSSGGGGGSGGAGGGGYAGGPGAGSVPAGGTPNTGGGGGGQTGFGGPNASGASGIVIIYYVGSTTINIAGFTYLSNNYGLTFSPNPVLATGVYTSVSVSSTGQYMIANTTNRGYFSNNYGSSFSTYLTLSSTVSSISTSVSSTGQYMITGVNTGSLYLSSPPLVSTTTTNLNGMLTITDLSMSGNLYTPSIISSIVNQPTNLVTNIAGTFTANPAGLSTSAAYSSVATSENGQYQLACINGGSVYLSTNYGTLFTANPTGLLTSAAYSAVATSANGQYQLACITGGSVYLSSNFGTSFAANPTGLVTVGAYGGVSMSSTGQYQLASITGGSVYLSSNYGTSFSNIAALSTGLYKSVSMSSTGQYMLTHSGQSSSGGSSSPPTINSGTSPTTTTNGSYSVLTFTSTGTTTLTFPSNTQIGYLVVGGGATPTYPGWNFNGGGGGGISWSNVSQGPITNSLSIVVGGKDTSSSITGTGINIIGGAGTYSSNSSVPSAGGSGTGGVNNLTGGTGGLLMSATGGGIGKQVIISDIGLSSYYSGGGSGGYVTANNNAAFLTGGLGGGGNGANVTTTTVYATSGSPNTGGGGGGQDGQTGTGQAGYGGSGIVIIYYSASGTVNSGGGTTYLSNNYGLSFNPLISVSSSGFTSVSLSSTGQYQLACASPGGIYISNNFGSTFTLNPSGSSTSAAYSSTSVSSTGQYMLTSMTGTASSTTVTTLQTGPINAITTLLSGTPLATTMELVFRGSRDGHTASAFHTKCNGKSPLFFIFKADTGYIATAYTNVAYSGSPSAHVSGISGTCWLNNLQSNTGAISTSKAFNNVYPQYTLYDNPSYGPTFGAGHDLHIPDNWTTASGYTNVHSYSGIGSGNTTLFFGSYNTWKITEIEVYTTTSNTANTLSNVISAGTIFPGTSSQSTVISNNGGVYLSSNYGNSFSSIAALSTGNYTSVSISSTGQYALACISTGSVYISTATMTQSVISRPFTNIKGYVGFTDASGSATGADAKALVEINGVGNMTTGTYTDNYSLYTSGSVLIGQNLSVASDRRIKTNIQDVNDMTALSVIRQLQPKQYTYIDTANRGTQPVWGYIAQDVKSILNYAVNTVTDYIPNIYYNVKINRNILTFPNPTQMITNYDESGNTLPQTEHTDPTIPTTANFTQNEDGTPIQIKLIDILSKRVIQTSILQIPDGQTMIVSDDLSQYENLFLYGQKVTDFNVLDKNAVFTIASAALQEVDEELQATKVKVADLIKRKNALM